jgi:hypothetical protein
MLKERHGLPWPFAAIIAKDIIALRVVDGSLSLPLDPQRPMMRRRAGFRHYDAEERDLALEEFRKP